MVGTTVEELLTLVLLSLSEPAKSTKFNLETVYLALDCTLDLVCNVK